MPRNLEINPWSFQFELVEGCNYKCMFCPVYEIESLQTNWNCMTMDLIDTITKQINTWRPGARIEINNHGEPTLHPEFFEVLKLMRKNMPTASLQLQTNMSIAMKSGPIEFIHKAFECGLNLFVANCYSKNHYIKMNEIHKSGDLPLLLPGVNVIDFYYGNPKNVSAYHNHGPNAKILFIMDDLGRAQEVIGSKGRAKLIINEGGSTSKEYLESKGHEIITGPLNKPCSRVFREMTFGWNGIVPLCCYDWTNGIVFGKVPEENIKDIWESVTWMQVRGLLSNDVKFRNFSPCDKCDYNGGFRIGLLPPVPEQFMPRTPEMINKFSKDICEHMKHYTQYQYPGTYHANGEVYHKKDK